MPPSSRPSVLLVCTANVCRSPLAAAVLRDRLDAAGIDIAVGSAGTRGLDAAPMCAVSATELPSGQTGVAHDHRSRPLTPEDVAGADLVLTMEREQRSATVRLAPGSQAKVFTLREAAALLGALQERRWEPISEPQGLAQALHATRGTVPLTPEEPPRTRWWRRAEEPKDPLTIEDGHGRPDPEHRAAVEQVRVTAEQVADGVVRLLGR